MTQFVHELRAQVRPALLWALGMSAIAGLYLSLFPNIARDADTFRQIFASYPAAVQHMLGVTLDSIASLPGFYSMVLTFVVLCASLQAAYLGLALISREGREGTADFVYTRPVSRASIVGAKLAAALVTLVATDVVYWGVALALAAATGAPYDGQVFVLLNATVLLVPLMFFSLGLLVAVALGRVRSVLPLSLGLVFGFYLLGALVASGDDGKWFLSPFRYFDLHDIVVHARYQPEGLYGALALVVVGVVVAFIVTLRRDIHVR